MEIDLEGLDDLTRRLSEGKPRSGDIERYQAVCKEMPEFAWEFGVLTSLKRDTAIQNLHASTLVKESVKANIRELERQMGLEKAKGVESILIENVITCWFSLQIAENKADAALEQNKPIAVIDLYGRRLDSAHSRFSRAVSSLAQYRKVSVQIQINIAEQQVITQAGGIGRSGAGE
jgi:hypothetical protein